MCILTQKMVEEFNIDESINSNIDNMLIQANNTIYKGELEKCNKIVPQISKMLEESYQSKDEKDIIKIVVERIAMVSKLDLQSFINQYINIVNALKTFYSIDLKEKTKEENNKLSKPKVKKIGVHPAFGNHFYN